MRQYKKYYRVSNEYIPSIGYKIYECDTKGLKDFSFNVIDSFSCYVSYVYYSGIPSLIGDEELEDFLKKESKKYADKVCKSLNYYEDNYLKDIRKSYRKNKRLRVK